MRNILSINKSGFPKMLATIPSAPKTLYVESDNLAMLMQQPRLAVVGSRKVSSYGRSVTESIVHELARAGVVIVSGLALGIDSVAHKAALDAGGQTIAVLPGGVRPIYPSSHRQLAQQIVAQGGALISEHPDNTNIFKPYFVARSRIVTGLSDGLLVTEAASASGTMHTAQFAKKQGRPLFAVPGAITSPSSAGTNGLIQQGAHLVTSAEDILKVLGITRKPVSAHKHLSDDPNEQVLIDLLESGISDSAELLNKSELDARIFSQALTMLEINGIIMNSGNNSWRLT